MGLAWDCVVVRSIGTLEAPSAWASCERCRDATRTPRPLLERSSLRCGRLGENPAIQLHCVHRLHLLSEHCSMLFSGGQWRSVAAHLSTATSGLQNHFNGTLSLDRSYQPREHISLDVTPLSQPPIGPSSNSPPDIRSRRTRR